MGDRVVITGMGLVSPIGNGLAEVVDRLRGGPSGLGHLSLFEGDALPAVSVGEVKDFDLEERRLRWPALRLDYDRKVFFAMEAARQALEDAGLVERPELLASIALDLGSSLESFLVQQLLEIHPGSFEAEAFFEAYLKSSDQGLLQTPLDRAPQLIAETWGFRGPSWIHCSACAAGLQACGHALRVLRRGEADVLLAGGTDSMLNPLGLGGFALLGALSPERDDPATACRPFDTSRGGTVLGEGAAFLVMETLGHARARGARIRGELLGFGTSLDAYRVSDPDPEGRGAVAAMKAALGDAGLPPTAIDVISAHGTGTELNDPMETAAIKTVFGPRAAAIPVLGLKSYTGHLIGASGPVELVECLGAFAEGFLPPTLHLHQADPRCDLDHVPLKARPARVGRFLKNSFGLGGQNASLIVATPEGMEP